MAAMIRTIKARVAGWVARWKRPVTQPVAAELKGVRAGCAAAIARSVTADVVRLDRHRRELAGDDPFLDASLREIQATHLAAIIKLGNQFRKGGDVR